MTSFLYRMPAGIPGAISRMQDLGKVEAQVFDATNLFTEYGLAGKISATGTFEPIASGDAISVVYGFLVRPYPTQDSPLISDPLGSATPNTQQPANVLKSGYLNVKNYRGTAAKNGTVYVRVQDTDATGYPLGSITADQDSTTPADTVALPGAYFTGEADSDGNAEIAYNI